MIDQVVAAFDRQDYQAAAQILQQLVKQSPQDPWVQLYVARLYEVQGKAERAEGIYRQLLKATTNQKVLTQARQGIQRLEAAEVDARKAAIAQARTTDPNSTVQGCLILEPLTPEEKTAAAPKFARLMQLDPYTARLLLPSRYWRFYRTGAIADLQVYQQDLQAIGVPAFCASYTQLQAPQIFWVERLQVDPDQITVRCRNQEQQLGHLTFQSGEITACLEGALPLFESVVDVDFKRQTFRKDQIRDYAKLLDLHLQQRRCILRLCDQTYQFSPEGEVKAKGALVEHFSTIPQRWQQAMAEITPHLPPVLSAKDFAGFVDTAMDQEEFLKGFLGQTQVLPSDSKPWEAAFHLYSLLRFSRAES